MTVNEKLITGIIDLANEEVNTACTFAKTRDEILTLRRCLEKISNNIKTKLDEFWVDDTDDEQDMASNPEHWPF